MAEYQGYEKCAFYGDNFNPDECYKCDVTVCPNRFRVIVDGGSIKTIDNVNRPAHYTDGKIEVDYAPIVEKLTQTINNVLKDGFKNLSRNIGVKNNPYWERITDIANRQREKGISEYGKGLECDSADIMIRLDRIEEELIDALMYLEHLRDGIRGVNK